AILSAADRNLVHSSSGNDALRRLLNDDFAVVLLDVRMPDLDGFETARLIRGRDRSRATPIIFLTAAPDELQEARGYALGAVDYITKPFEPDTLRSKVAVFVDLFRKSQQLRRQAAELAATTLFLNSILDSSTGYAIVALDLDGRILAWNAGARNLYHLTAEEVVGECGFERLFSSDDAGGGEVRGFLDRALSVGRVESVFEQVRADGSRFTASIVLDHRTDSAGTPLGFVAIIQDITDRLRAEEERTRLVEERAARAEAEAARRQIEEINRLLRETVEARDRALERVENALSTRDEFLSAASHDLRTPLTVIRAQAQLLARRAARTADAADREHRLDALNKITISTRKMARLVDQMLDVAQLQADQPLQLDRRPTDLVRVAREAVAEISDTLPRHQLHFEANVTSITGLWDAARLERVVSNLLANAVKYSPEGGDILVSVLCDQRGGDGEWAILRVVDHGVGIPADQLPRVFDRFFRGRNVVGRIYGTGIGLAGVRQIVEQHEGTIALDSAEGRGTTVTIQLPLAVPPTESGTTNRPVTSRASVPTPPAAPHA
ncbi:MAG: response regulator, partial [Chloroflexi bacterium]|nr:response regulator [Chloroflexota bacterium]